MYTYDASMLMRIFVLFMILFGILLVCLSIAFVIWMLIDCIKRKESDFKDRTLWIILLVLGIFLGYSFIISIVYYFAVKRELDKK